MEQVQEIKTSARRNTPACLAVIAFLGALPLIWGQNAIEVAPQNYRLTFDNRDFRVIRVIYRPHEHVALHSHPATPTLYVYLTDSGPVRFSHEEEHAFSLIRPPEKAGTFRFSPGRLEKHTVDNLGDIDSQFLRVELKTLPLGYGGNSVRGPKTFDAVHSGLRREFESDRLEIDRIVAAPQAAVTVPHASGDALLIALADTSIESDAGGDARLLKLGEVFCPDPARDYRIRSQHSSTVGHMLRVLIKP